MYFKVKSLHVFYDVSKTTLDQLNWTDFKEELYSVLFIFSRSAWNIPLFSFRIGTNHVFTVRSVKWFWLPIILSAIRKGHTAKCKSLSHFWLDSHILVTIKAHCFNKSALFFFAYWLKAEFAQFGPFMCWIYNYLSLISHRHNPKNNTFTSVYETPVNINAKKQSVAASEVRLCLHHRQHKTQPNFIQSYFVFL